MPINGSLKWLHSPDLIDMRVDQPSDADDFRILVQAMIGVEGKEGYESFDFEVCSPKWLANNMPSEGYLFGIHRLIVNMYSYENIRIAIQHLCQRTWGSTWTEVANKLGQYAHWEFEGFQGNQRD